MTWYVSDLAVEYCVDLYQYMSALTHEILDLQVTVNCRTVYQ